MSEFIGKITVASLSGVAINYIVDLGQPAIVLKTFVQRDFRIAIKQQQLFHNKVYE